MAYMKHRVVVPYTSTTVIQSQLRRALSQWCIEHCGISPWGMRDGTRNPNFKVPNLRDDTLKLIPCESVFMFEHQEDAVAFALVWRSMFDYYEVN